MPPTLQSALNQMAASSMAELLLGVLKIQLGRGDIDQHAAPLLEVITNQVTDSKDAMEEIIIEHLGRMAETCEWMQSADDAFWVEYDTTCGETHAFDAHVKNMNGFSYCPYCGRRLTSARTGQGGDSALEDGSDPEGLSTPE